MRISLLCLAGLVANALAAPSPRHALHERRNGLPPGWSRKNRMSSEEKLPMRIALTQSNLDKGEQFLLDVSHPDSSNYGRHWSAKKIAETFAPSQDSVDAVKDWLTTSGISGDRISQTDSFGWLKFDATVGEAEGLLKTEFYRHEHDTGKPHIACDEYHVPEDVRQHVDFITPTIHFDTKIPQSVAKRADSSSTAAVGNPVPTKAAVNVIKSPTNGFLPKKGKSLGRLEDIFTELGNCNEYITPNCLRALYLFPPGISASPQNSFGIVEYTPQAYLQSDLDLFFSNFSKNQVQKTPTTRLIDGAIVQTTNQGFGYNGESDLDLEYAMALINPQKVTLYQVGDTVEGASFNNFLDAIDGDYCTYLGGDDPSQDGVYPDPFPGGYKGAEQCGAYAATKVISTSYGYNEADLTAKYEQRQCNEYLKLGLQGVSIFYSSGDNGVAGNGAVCLNPDGTYNNGGTGRFNPAFPATCPFVTSVGATQIVPGASVTQPEEACETVIYSGGGFSNVFPIPDYQRTALATYFKNHNPSYGADRYNNSGRVRGYPDISANGANYVVAVDGQFNLVYGTSASSPTVGAIFTLINEARIRFGKKAVGFVNPVLYAYPYLLNDITKGGNQGCGTPGFKAVKGWDPVTGLGTPNFPRLVGRFLSLP